MALVTTPWSIDDPLDNPLSDGALNAALRVRIVITSIKEFLSDPAPFFGLALVARENLD